MLNAGADGETEHHYLIHKPRETSATAEEGGYAREQLLMIHLRRRRFWALLDDRQGDRGRLLAVLFSTNRAYCRSGASQECSRRRDRGGFRDATDRELRFGEFALRMRSRKHLSQKELRRVVHSPPSRMPWPGSYRNTRICESLATSARGC
jgi:hypothetical protein